MKTKIILTVTILSAAVFGLTGCAGDRPARSGTAIQVTVPNGSSPAKANAPHAPMNDTPAMRSSWNHGSSSLWVLLEPDSIITVSEPAPKDSAEEIKGYYRAKFGWWRGGPGKFSIEGKRLDAAAPALRYLARPESYGAFGFIPTYLYFPTEGYWEITGRLDADSLTFVVHVVKKSEAAQ
jgi:hypothetical protein